MPNFLAKFPPLWNLYCNSYFVIYEIISSIYDPVSKFIGQSLEISQKILKIPYFHLMPILPGLRRTYELTEFITKSLFLEYYE